jgi:hypothetical protein
MRKVWPVWALVASGVFAAADAAAQQSGPPFGFGAPGQTAISSDFSAQLGTHAEMAPGGNNPPSTTTVELRPALDVFVVQNLSVGGQIGLTWTSGGWKHTEISVAPRVGYDVPITDRVSFWPKGGPYFSVWSDQATSVRRLGAFVVAPFLYHPAPHFFVGLGPAFAIDLFARQDGQPANKNLDFALSTTVGGWF